MGAFIIHDVNQNTEEWFALRRGRITGSIAKTFLVNGKSKSGFGVGALDLIRKAAEEKVTGQTRENFSNKATDWGHENEEIARKEYSIREFKHIRQVGFISKGEWLGYSPDGLMGEEIIEFKCLPKEHINILISDKPDYSHVIQVNWGMWITGYENARIVYFHPWFPENTRFKVFNIAPDKELFARFEERSQEAIKEIKKIIKIIS